MKKIRIWFPLLFAITMIVGMWIGFRLRGNIPESQGFFQPGKRTSLQEVYDLVRTNYVDSINTDTLTEDAIQAMLNHLDPHSIYIPAVHTEEANEDLKGNFQGIGVEYQIIDDTVHIVNVLVGGPSDKAGVQLGDKVLKVDSVPIAGREVTGENIKKLVRGEDGSKVTLIVLRANKNYTITITRGVIPKYAVDAAYMMDGETGFIHLNKFSQTTYEEFMAALEKLQKKGMKKLVLDMRSNGGGILDEAVDIADEFLSGEKLITYTYGVHSPKREYKSKRPGLFEKGPVALLVDEFSASATEVLAGALQDWDRATIVGRKTFGKGLVQEPFELTNGAQLRLTVARYYTPVGRNIQKPFSNSHTEYEAEIYKRFHNGQVLKGDTTHSGKIFKTPGGKIVYGGGAITPDIFVPFDTTPFSGNIASLFQDQVFGQFVYKYYIDNRSYFKNFKDALELAKNFTPDQKAWDDLKRVAIKDSINLDFATPRDKAELERRMKSWMARQIWNMEGYYQVNNLFDPAVQRALAVVRQQSIALK